MAYEDLATIHVPATGNVPPFSWGTQIRDNFEFLIFSPACSIFNSTTQTLTTGTDTVLTANSENYDTDGMHSTVSLTSRIVIQTPGLYHLNAEITSDVNGNGIRKVEFLVNGTTALNGLLINATASPFATDIQATRSSRFVAGDYVEVRAYQSSGANNAVTLREFFVKFEGR